MKIANESVVSIHYTLTDDDGAVLDSSDGRDPLRYLHGAGNIIPGLETALEGSVEGDAKKVTVSPQDGYGEHDKELVQALPRNMFTGIDKIEAGMEFQAQSPTGEAQFVVVKEVTEDTVTVDGNHALAGKTLHFDVKVEEVREATDEEKEHGHVH